MARVQDYVNLGYSGLVILSSESKESQSGMQQEVERETLVCRDKKKRCLRITGAWISDGLNPPRFRSEREELISETQYQKLVQERKGPLDDQRFYAERQRRQMQCLAAQNELANLTPHCPKCSVRMTLRVNSRDQSRFWGCTQYPNCGGTRSADAATLRRIDDLSAFINSSR